MGGRRIGAPSRQPGLALGVCRLDGTALQQQLTHLRTHGFERLQARRAVFEHAHRNQLLASHQFDGLGVAPLRQGFAGKHHAQYAGIAQAGVQIGGL